MNEHEKSDECVVPVKHVNKDRAAARSAERVEERRSTKGNSTAETKNRSQSRGILQQNLRRVREAADRYRGQQLTSLWHHCYNVDHLRSVFLDMKKTAAPGVDGVTWYDYEENLEDNLQNLSGRLARGAYRARPVRRTYIPKSDGKQRPLGIPTVEDKIVQGITKKVLDEVYERIFCGFSHGFRPKRKAHDALDALSFAIKKRSVSWVLDADIRGFFDAIDHGCLMEMVERQIGDQRVLRHIKKWLNAGVLENEKKWIQEYGTPQGGSISPLLANVYLHFAFDMWADEWRQTEARGEVYVVRYADDFVVCFEYQDDAKRFLEQLKERFKRFHLELHPDKTRLIEFGRYAAATRKRKGRGKPETFDFLGFTHYCAKTRTGRFQAGRKTQRAKAAAKLKGLQEELMRRMHDPVSATGAWLARVLRGHYNYYGVPGNAKAMGSFRNALSRLWYTALRRRSQKGRLPWTRMSRILNKWLPLPKITHAWPDDRFRAKYPR